MSITFRRSPLLMKTFWLLPGFVLLALAPLPIMAGIGALGVVGAIVLWKHQRLAAYWREIKPIWPLMVVLAIFFFFPYTNVAPSMRAPGAYFSVYSYFAGLFSVFNLALIAALAIILVDRIKYGRINLVFGDWRSIGLLYFMILIAFAIGLLHSDGGLLHYGITEFKRPIIALIPSLYMLAIFVLVVNSVRIHDSLLRLMRWIDHLTLCLVIYGIYRLFMILTGDLETMWMFGLPIVLYDQMALFYVPIFSSFARWTAGRGASRLELLQFVIMILFILCSTRRYNYLLLAMGFILIVYLSRVNRVLSVQRLRRVVMSSAAALGLATLFLVASVPKFVDGVVGAFQSLDLSSRVGQKHGGDIRAAIIENIFANLDRRPYAYVSGFGLGTMWQAIEQQPIDPLTKMLRRNDGWYAQFSVPYISLLFRLGLVGTVCLLVWLFCYLKARIQDMRSFPPWLQSYAIGIAAYVAMIIPGLADSLNPTGWILCGLYMGLLERFAAFTHHERASLSDEHQRHSP